MLYRYIGFDENGKKVRAKLEAKSLQEVKAKLRAKGILHTSLKEDSSGFGKISFKRSKKLDLSTLAYLSRDLSIYLKSGATLIDSVNLLKQRYQDNKQLFNFFDTIKTYLDEGKNFYNALESQKAVKLPEFYKQSIKVSENGGLLESVLMELSLFLKEQDRLKKQVSTAMSYPLFILFVSFFVVAYMLSAVVPKIAGIFTQMDQQLPKSTQIVIATGNFFSHNYVYIVVFLIVFILSFIYLLKKSYLFRFSFDKFLLKLPFFSKLIEQSELARFSYMNSILIKSGVSIVQAINLSSNILKNEVIKKVFVESSQSVVEGKRLSILLSQNSTYSIDDSFIHSIAIGEDTSRLSEILNSLAQLYSESNKDKTAIFISLLEPIFMLIVGSVIGFIVISMLLPIFSMNLG